MHNDLHTIAELTAEVDRLRNENALLYSANCIILRWEPSGTITYINEFGLTFFGYSQKELIHKPINILIAETDTTNEKFTDLANQIVHDPDKFSSYTSENICKNGNRVYITWTNKTITDSTGNILEILAIGNDITIHKKTEEALRQANATLDALFETSPIPIDIFDDEYRFFKVSKQSAAYYGLTREQVVGKSTAELNPVFYKGSLEGVFKKVLHTGNIIVNQEVKVENPLKKNELLYFRASFFPVPLPGGKKGVGTISIDITDIKKAEQEQEKLLLQVQQHVAELNAVIESMPDAVYIGTAAGITQCNRHALTMLGANSVKDLNNNLNELGKKFSMRWPDSGQLLREDEMQFTRALKGETVIEEVLATNAATGMDIYIRAANAPIIVDGKIIGAVAIHSDITDRKEAEYLLNKSALEYKTLAENIPEVIARFDRDLHHTFINKYGAKVYGIPKDHVIGKTNAELGMQPEKVALWKEQFDKVLKTGLLQTMNFDFDSPNFGHQFFSSLFVPEFNGGNHVISILVITRDITELKQAGDQLKQSENRFKILTENLETIVVQRTEQVRSLSTALTLAEQRERKRFSYILHENLQQQLFGARMLLKQHFRDHEATKEITGNEELIDGIKILDKALRLTISLSMELNPPILRTQGLDAALRWLISHMYKTYGLEVDFTQHGSVNMIKDETQLMLTQMVRELLDNVIKYSGVLKADLIVNCEDRSIKIIVSDAGKGFTPNSFHIKTGEESQLGLFSIKERLKLFGGKLEIESKINHGTRCTIHLPYSNC